MYFVFFWPIVYGLARERAKKGEETAWPSLLRRRLKYLCDKRQFWIYVCAFFNILFLYFIFPSQQRTYKRGWVSFFFHIHIHIHINMYVYGFCVLWNRNWSINSTAMAAALVCANLYGNVQEIVR